MAISNSFIGKKNEENFEIPPLPVYAKDVVKLRSILRQFVRDWSKEGEHERTLCYTPIKEEFKNYFPEPIVDGRKIKVLLPGAGLGRLVFDFAAMGYAAQGNEFSYFMLLSSNFILNLVNKEEEFEIHPFLHSYSNVFEEKDPIIAYKIPDVNPQTLPLNSDFSMVAGEFVEVYKSQLNEWDSVVTCYFIDTANNIISYIETIYGVLKEGGVWINLGPLLYHYADMGNYSSIELSWEEVKHVILKMGFEIVRESVKESTYAAEKRTMMTTLYSCVFFTAIKRGNSSMIPCN